MSIEQLPAAAVKGEVLLMIRELPTASSFRIELPTYLYFVSPVLPGLNEPFSNGITAQRNAGVCMIFV